MSIATNGVISGTPTSSGSSIQITVTASNGVSPDATKTFYINVAAAPAAPSITTAAGALASGTQNSSYSQQISATGNPTPTFSATGLPAGLSISTSGLIREQEHQVQ
jgi:hypothetical protein